MDAFDIIDVWGVVSDATLAAFAEERPPFDADDARFTGSRLGKIYRWAHNQEDYAVHSVRSLLELGVRACAAPPPKPRPWCAMDFFPEEPAP